MENKCPEGDFGFFAAHLDQEVLHIQFRENFLEHLVDFSKRDIVSLFADQVSKCSDVKVILLNSDFHESGIKAYTRFLSKQSKSRDLLGIHRLFNLTSQLILGIIGLDRIVIHACQGNVISLFLNISLACDYRIAADNTVFCNPYLDIGMVPMGGGPYFLSQRMGAGKIWETLLLKRNISVQQALELDLVDRIVPQQDLDVAAFDIAHEFARYNSRTIAGIKNMTNFSKKDFIKYFETEKREIFKIFANNDFSKQIEGSAL